HPMVDSAAAITLVKEIWVRSIKGHHRLDTAIGSVSVEAHSLDRSVIGSASIQFVREIEVQPKTRGEIRSCRINLACGRDDSVRPVALDADKVVAVQPRAIEPVAGNVRGRVGSYVVPAHNFVPHQGLRQSGSRISRSGRPERPKGEFRGLLGKSEVP